MVISVSPRSWSSLTSAGTLPPAFFDRPVLQVARDLVGCGFFFDGAGGRIVETEAYAQDDPCCHGYRGRTARNAVLFGAPGLLYVYFTYGMHFCANLVCEQEGRAAAVLLRALEPLEGIERMAERRGRADARALCSGPAKLAQALGIGRAQNGLPAWRAPLRVTPRPGTSAADPATWWSAAPRIAVTPRIGVGGDPRPWRFVDADSAFLSRPLAQAGRRGR
jgi:DNA-3-methyladenine glycosylase